jgi:hypothetical protein
MIHIKINEHLINNNTTYIKHFINTFLFSIFLGVYAFKIFIHSFLPFLFIDVDIEVIKYGSEYIKVIYKD